MVLLTGPSTSHSLIGLYYQKKKKMVINHQQRLGQVYYKTEKSVGPNSDYTVYSMKENHDDLVH